MKNLKLIARYAGLMYLIIIISGIFSEVFVRESLINWTNNLETFENIKNVEFQFRMSIIADLIMVISDIFLAILFYYLLKPANKFLSLTAMIFRLTQATIISINLVFQIISIFLIENSVGSSFSEIQLTELNNIFLLTHNIGYIISGVFFGVSCIIAGLLFRKNIHLPNIFGFFLIFGGAAYLQVALAKILLTEYIEITEAVLMITAIFSELSVCIYLLIWGIKK